MRQTAKRIIMMAAIIILSLASAGCFKANFEVTIDDMGMSTVKLRYLCSGAGKMQLEMLHREIIKKYGDIGFSEVHEGDMSGYEVSKGPVPLEIMASGLGDQYSDNVKVEHNWLYNTYIIDVKKEGIKELAAVASLAKLSPKQRPEILLTVNLPSPAESQNATSVRNGSKTLEWDLTPCFLEGKPIDIELKFTMINKMRLAGVIAGAAVLFGAIAIIAAIIIVTSRKSAKRDIVRNDGNADTAPASQAGKTCPKCKEIVPRNATFCMNCGADLQPTSRTAEDPLAPGSPAAGLPEGEAEVAKTEFLNQD
ncbi:MAG: zinc ribbon domain-containing protein [bacterium]|nr:zinc ribbon domain-containing protein [bacterium]